MGSAVSFVNFAVPYVLVCGSYERNRINDKFCDVLGNKIAKHNIGIVSAGGRPGIKIGDSVNKTLTASGRYEPTKMVTVYRKKGPKEKLRVTRMGCCLFVGNTIDEMRSYLFTKSKVLIVIGGGVRTREEVQLAEKAKISVLPIGSTGGTAYDVWLEYYQSEKYNDEPTFLKLNNKNPSIAASAVIRSLVELILDDRIEMHKNMF